MRPSSAWQVGAGGGLGLFPWIGDIAQIVLDDVALTSEQLQDDVAYFSDRYQEQHPGVLIVCGIDSRTSGIDGTAIGGITTYPWPLQMNTANPTWIVYNRGISALTLEAAIAEVSSNYNTVFNPLYKCIFVGWGGVNNYFESENAATAGALLLTLAQDMEALGWMTVIPLEADWEYYTGEPQMPDVWRAEFNSWVLANILPIPGARIIVRTDLNIYVGVDGAAYNTTYYDGAELHMRGETNSGSPGGGYAVMASLFGAGVQSFLANISASPSVIERGQPGQTITLSGTGIDFSTAVASNFTLTGSTITAYNPSTFVLTFTASSSIGTLTLTHVPTGVTCTLTCVDTTPPPNPTGVTGGTATLTGSTYSFSISWASQTDTYGGTVTFRVYQNGIELTTAPGQSGTTYAVTGANLLDVFTVTAQDASGNISGASAYLFQIPIPTNVASTTYPVVTIDDVDLGLITQIDQNQYQYINVQNIPEPVTVTITSPYENCQIRYTLNGKIPNPSSHLYCGPLTFTMDGSGSEHTAIKARVYDLANANNKSKIIRLAFRVIPTE